MMTSTLRGSNAKAKQELGWAPSSSTYRQGIERLAKS
jgi:nucleoside-diphosphate-sugar epimerase